jgi:hypothetical protein
MSSGGAPGDAAQSGGRPARGGGGGGAAGADHGNFAPDCGALGGGGGGIVVLRAPTVVNVGRVAVDGGDGAGSFGWERLGASGGGGAGALIVEATTFDNLGIVTANGGRGGGHSGHVITLGCAEISAGGAGGGGGGYVWLDVGALGAGSFDRISVGGGVGGAIECTSPPGERGTDGIRCCRSAIAGCAACPP